MDLKNTEHVKVGNRNIVKSISGGVLIWSREQQIRNYLIRASEKLQIRDGRGRWHGGEGVTHVYNVDCDFTFLPTTIEGYDVSVNYRSSKSYLLSDKGEVTRPIRGVSKVNLYATITHRKFNVSVTKVFLIYII